MTARSLREQTKALLDTADDRIVRLVHAMLEADAEEGDTWEEVPDDVLADLEKSIAQADRGEVFTHAEVKARYPQWFTK